MRLGELVGEVRELREPQEVSGMPYIGLEHIGKGTLALVGVGAAGDVTTTKKAFRQGDILFGSLRPYFRKVVRPCFDGVCSTDITVLRPRTAADGSFAFYAVASPGVIELATRSSNGTRMPRARWDVLSGFELGSFSAKERHRVGGWLAAYDDLIENGTRRIGTLEEIARALHREWFVGTDTGRLPDGWTRRTLGDHVDRLRQTVEPGDVSPGTPYFGLEHLPRRSTTLRVWGRADDCTSTKLRVAAGNILFGKIRPYFHKVGVASVSGVCSTDAAVLRPRRDELRAAVLGCVSSDGFVARASASAQGAKMPRASWDIMRREPLPLPPEPLLLRYDDLAGTAIRMATTLGLQTRALATTRDLILTRFLSKVERARPSRDERPREARRA